MSIDTREPIGPESTSSHDRIAPAWLGEVDWDALAGRIHKHRDAWVARKVFGPAGKTGGVYRWGVAVARGEACDDLVQLLSRLACGAKVSKKHWRNVDLTQSVSDWHRALDERDPLQPIDAAAAVLWAASLPWLLDYLAREDWQLLLRRLLSLRDAAEQQRDVASSSHLMLAAELGLTLAILLPDASLRVQPPQTSAGALNAWCRSEADSIPASLRPLESTRLVLASLLRCKRLVAAEGIKNFDKKSWKRAGRTLATWVTAMTTPDGGSAMSEATGNAVDDDTCADGLLDHAIRFDRESLKPAMAAATGRAPKAGRLRWEVSLPDSLLHDPYAKVAAMLPQWDVSRGRMYIDYGESILRIEVLGGPRPLALGSWDTLIETDGQMQQPCGEWQEVCEYSDDDVHYLELEQTWTGGIVLQRQMMLLREDRCVLLADAVLPSTQWGPVDEPQTSRHEEPSGSLGSIRYTSRLPLEAGAIALPEEETREVVLSVGGKKAMFVPLAANEWRVGPSDGDLFVSDDRHLAMTVRGQRRVYAPLWIDLQPSRFKRNRTWRRLTVADQLQLLDSDEAVGYRIQMGSEQWMIYRSFGHQRARSVLGRHLLADFYCSRFDPGDGSHEELISVDEGESHDD